MVPIKSDSLHFPIDGKLKVYRSRTGGNEWEALTNGLPQKDCYVNVLRDAMAVDRLDDVRRVFRDDGRAGVLLAGWRATRGRRSCTICRRCCRLRCRRCMSMKRAARAGGAAVPPAQPGAGGQRDRTRDCGAGDGAERGGCRRGAVSDAAGDRFATRGRNSGGRFCGSLRARRICRMSRSMRRCRRRWRRGKSRC